MSIILLTIPPAKVQSPKNKKMKAGLPPIIELTIGNKMLTVVTVIQLTMVETDIKFCCTV